MQPNATAPLDSAQRHSLLVRGLIGNNQALFLNSATYHSQMNLLASMLTTWADALAKESEATQSDLAERWAQLADTPLTVRMAREILDGTGIRPQS